MAKSTNGRSESKRKQDSEQQQQQGDANLTNDRLLRAARRYVQEHGDEKDDTTHSTTKKRHSSQSSRRNQKEDEPSQTRERDDRGRDVRRHDRSSHERRKRSKGTKSDHRHKSYDSESRRGRSGRRSDDDRDSDNDRRRTKRRKSKSHRDKEKRSSNDKPRKGKRSSHKHRHSNDNSRSSSSRLSHTNLPIHNADLFPIGPITTAPPTIPIDPEKDYFSFHPKLRLYLYRTTGTFFEDLNATETRSAFATFCVEYNQGRLEEAYYNDISKIPTQALQECKRTRHVWKFNTNHTEQKSLDLIKAGVRKQTEYDVKVTQQRQSGASLNQCRKVIIPPRRMEGAQTEKDQDNQSVTNNVNKERAVLKLIGLDSIKSGQKITIAPREDSR